MCEGEVEVVVCVWVIDLQGRKLFDLEGEEGGGDCLLVKGLQREKGGCQSAW